MVRMRWRVVGSPSFVGAGIVETVGGFNKPVTCFFFFFQALPHEKKRKKHVKRGPFLLS